ncbi:MAG TPA: hypothetical protein VGL74_10280 [Terriglobales bacterium]|jgi:hypothetical protein
MMTHFANAIVASRVHIRTSTSNTSPIIASHFAEPLAKGEPNRKKIALTALSDKVRELI